MATNGNDDVLLKINATTITTTATTTATAATVTTTTTISMNQTNTNVTPCKAITASNKIKLCGYLKKKRNKVGGWRKLWFVLQDKLLLSYGSKEEYDNKLVSFKDVLNLVPGTMVRPLGGFRFTIETTSQAMYTFHCDDRIAYREWMAMLLDSLATTPQTTCVQQKFPHNRFGSSYAATSITSLATATAAQSSSLSTVVLATPTKCFASVDSIPHALSQQSGGGGNLQHKYWCRPLSRRNFATRSYDSISQVEPNTTMAMAMATPTSTLTPTPSPATMLMVKSLLTSTSTSTSSLTSPAIPTATSTSSKSSCVRMPIVQQTAKLLERNGVNSTQQQQQQQQHTQELHMFSNRKSLNHYDLEQRFVPATPTPTPITTTTLPTTTTILRFKAYESETAADLARLRPKTKFVYMKEYGGKATTTITTTITESMLEHSVGSVNGPDRSPTSGAHKAIDLMKDHIQRLSIKGNKEYTLDAFGQQQQRQQQQQQQQQQRCSVNMTSRMEQVIVVQEKERQQQQQQLSYELEPNNNNNNCRSCKLEQAQKKQQQQKHHQQQNTIDLNEKEPIYAVVDLQHKYEQRRLRNSAGKFCNLQLTKRCNSYDSILQFKSNGKANTNLSESIDLNKIEKRISSMEDDIDGIYEDGDKLFCQTAPHEHDEDEENIYEPINITTNYAQQTNRAFWQYFKRLKVKPLLQFTRSSKRNQHQSDYDVMRLPIAAASSTTTTATTTTSTAETATTTTNNTIALPLASTSHFANIKHKFGRQRKSIRAHMRKLCVRAAYEPKPLCNGNSSGNGSACSTSAKTKLTDAGVVAVDVDSAALPLVFGKQKNKFRNRWRTVKLRGPKNVVGVMPTTTTTPEIAGRPTRYFFGGSLPHLRKARISLFADQQLQQQQQQQKEQTKPKIKSHTGINKTLTITTPMTATTTTATIS